MGACDSALAGGSSARVPAGVSERNTCSNSSRVAAPGSTPSGLAPDAGGTVCYRMISTTPPEPGAEPAEPAVDDGYVALMHQLG